MSRESAGEHAGVIMDLFALGTAAAIYISISAVHVCEIDKSRRTFVIVTYKHDTFATDTVTRILFC